MLLKKTVICLAFAAAGTAAPTPNYDQTGSLSPLPDQAQFGEQGLAPVQQHTAALFRRDEGSKGREERKQFEFHAGEAAAEQQQLVAQQDRVVEQPPVPNSDSDDSALMMAHNGGRQTTGQERQNVPPGPERQGSPAPPPSPPRRTARHDGPAMRRQETGLTSLHTLGDTQRNPVLTRPRSPGSESEPESRSEPHDHLSGSESESEPRSRSQSHGQESGSGSQHGSDTPIHNRGPMSPLQGPTRRFGHLDE